MMAKCEFSFKKAVGEINVHLVCGNLPQGGLRRTVWLG